MLFSGRFSNLLSNLALFSLSSIVNRETGEKKMSEKKYFRILVMGGSLYAKESGIHSTCEVLSVSRNGDDVYSAPFASLNLPRRGASCVLLGRGESSRIWIVGGCVQFENSSASQHVDSAEYFDLSQSRSYSGNAAKTEMGSWRLVPGLLNVGRSCFMATTVSGGISKHSTASDDWVLVLGGWDGAECLSSVECIRLRVDEAVVSNNNTTTGDSLSPRLGGTGLESTRSIVTSAPTDEETVSTADLISSIKNGCCCTSLVADAQPQPHRLSLLLVGGWDGRRTLNTIFRYTFTAGAQSSKADCATTLDGLLPYPVECHACVLQNDRAIYVIGGFDGLRVLDSIVRVDLKDNSATVLPTKLSTARECHCAQLLTPDPPDASDPLLVVFGGWDGFKALDSVEVFRVTPELPYLTAVPSAMERIFNCTAYGRLGRCSKYSLYSSNLLAVLTCLVAVGYGFWVIVHKRPFSALFDPKLYVNVAYLLIVIGLLSILVAVVGYYAASKELRCLMYSFSVTNLILFLMLLLAGIMGFVFQQQLRNCALNLQMLTALQNFYGQPAYPAVTSAWDMIQEQFHCCGVEERTGNGYLVWRTSKWHMDEKERRQLVPDSCCVRDANNEIVDLEACRRPDVQIANTSVIYGQGCYKKLENDLIWTSTLAGALGIAASASLLLPALFSALLARLIQK